MGAVTRAETIIGEFNSDSYNLRAGASYYKAPNSPRAVSASEQDGKIYWNFEDRSADEEGFILKDENFVEVVRTEIPDGDYLVQSNLTAGRAYTGWIYAWNQFGESAPAGPLTITAASVPSSAEPATEIETEEIIEPSITRWENWRSLTELTGLEAATRWDIPAVLAVALGNLLFAVSGAGFVPYLLYLWQIFSEPFLWLGRYRRRPWGVIYNSLTKQPIDLAIVRLFSRETGKLVGTRITDQQGRFGFIVPTGDYYLEVYRKGFIFPSLKMRNRQESVYDSVYLGGNLTVSSRQAIVNVNIPLDPTDESLGTKAAFIWRRRFWRKFGLVMSFVGPALSLVMLILTPRLLFVVFLAVHILLWLLFSRLYFVVRPSRWGVVYNSLDRRPIRSAVVRIFNQKYHELLETQISDGRGQFGFLVGPDDYVLTVDKPSFIFPSIKGGAHDDYRGGKITIRPGEMHYVQANIPLDPLNPLTSEGKGTQADTAEELNRASRLSPPL